MVKIEALAKFLDCDIEEIFEEGEMLCLGKKEYLVLTDEEADIKAAEEILESAWAFNKGFLDCHSDVISKMPDKSFSKIQEMCENANPIILALIQDKDHFVEDAISCDGRGHFLSRYDSEENEEGEYFIYRVS
ncbi:MAG: hypothetical protein Q8Q03_03115 [bacterium]|nr:hypothetical protein [bacterium]